MRLKCVAFVVTVLVSSSGVQPAFAGQSADPDSWSRVQAVRVGREVTIEMKSGSTIKGKLTSVSNDTLELSSKRVVSTFNRKDVKRVFTGGRGRAKGAMIGTLVGAGIGTGIGLLLYLPVKSDIVGWVVPALAVIGAGIGAAMGTLFGSRKRTLVYEVR